MGIVGNGQIVDAAAEQSSVEFARLAADDFIRLRQAVRLLEHPGFAARLASTIGKPIDLIGQALPASASQTIAVAATKGLEAALKVALRTMRQQSHPRSPLLHKALVTVSGAAGGAFGLAALPIELPVSTVIMLRSIAAIARSEGEDLSAPEAALACVQVFALGGNAVSAEAAESGYFAVRGVLAKAMSEAARFVAERGAIAEGGPILVRLINQIAYRFGVAVTQKLAAQAWLERAYGKNLVEAEYERLVREVHAAA
jgi:hypothetical protein